MQETRLSPESSNIAKGEYDAETKVLTIHFKRGGIYPYCDVPPDVWAAYKGTESVGKFFLAYVKDKYHFTQA